MTSKQPCIKRESSQPITLRKCILLASVSKKSILLAHPSDQILGGNNQIYKILLTAHTFKERVNLVALVVGPSTLHKTLHDHMKKISDHDQVTDCPKRLIC